MSNEKELGSGVPKVDIAQNIKNVVKNTTDFSLLLPVQSRVKTRLKELVKLSSAETAIIPQGNVKQAYTKPPKMHIAALKATIENGIGIITYAVYKSDKKGNKLITNHVSEVADGLDENGSVKYKKTISSSTYEYESQVIERFQKGKPMTTETL